MDAASCRFEGCRRARDLVLEPVSTFAWHFSGGGRSRKQSGALNYVVSPGGTLLYVPGRFDRDTDSGLVWLDREGNQEVLLAEPGGYEQPRISPDGGRVAFLIAEGAKRDIWVWDLGLETRRRVTFGASVSGGIAWSPDGDWIAFAASEPSPGGLFRKRADGTGAVERLAELPVPPSTLTYVPDGKGLVFDGRGRGGGLFLLPLYGSATPRLLLEGESAGDPSGMERNPQISTDGRWLVYDSNASGRSQIYVRPFSDVDGGRWQVTVDGGISPVWSPAGTELFYRGPRDRGVVPIDMAGALMTVPVETGSAFAYGAPRPAFGEVANSLAAARHYDVSLDGERILGRQWRPSSDGEQRRIVVVLDWIAELERVVPPGMISTP